MFWIYVHIQSFQMYAIITMCIEYVPNNAPENLKIQNNTFCLPTTLHTISNGHANMSLDLELWKCKPVKKNIYVDIIYLELYRTAHNIIFKTNDQAIIQTLKQHHTTEWAI